MRGVIELPADLIPADGRFGCGPSKVRPAQVAALADSPLGTSHRQEPVKRLVDGERTAYRRAPIVAARERAGHAAAVLARHAPDAELIGELTVMVEWLGAFHPDSWIELDYGGRTRHVWPDDSVFDLWTLIDALEEGDEATAGVAQERLNRRWATVGMLARLT